MILRSHQNAAVDALVEAARKKLAVEQASQRKRDRADQLTSKAIRQQVRTLLV